jgi:hypothetical protein
MNQRQRFKIDPFYPRIAVAIVLIGSLYFIPDLYNSIDDSGWIPHKKAVAMFMAPDWLVGENRVCTGVQTTSNGKPPREINALFCPQESNMPTSHNFIIKFWGETSRDPKTDDSLWGASFHWRCNRGANDFTCYALD